MCYIGIIGGVIAIALIIIIVVATAKKSDDPTPQPPTPWLLGEGSLDVSNADAQFKGTNIDMKT